MGGPLNLKILLIHKNMEREWQGPIASGFYGSASALWLIKPDESGVLACYNIHGKSKLSPEKIVSRYDKLPSENVNKILKDLSSSRKFVENGIEAICSF